MSTRSERDKTRGHGRGRRRRKAGAEKEPENPFNDTGERVPSGSSSVAPMATISMLVDSLNSSQAGGIKNINMRSLMIHDGGAIQIFRILTRKRLMVQSINMSMCGLTSKALVPLAALLQWMDSLHTLELHSNDIDDKGILVLAKALRHNRSVTRLTLQNNRLTARAAHALALTMRTNCTAWKGELNLWANRLGSEGLSALSLSLASNRAQVAVVNLRRCNIGCEGAAALAEALHSNSTITSIDLSHNLISDVGAAALGDGLAAGNTT